MLPFWLTDRKFILIVESKMNLSALNFRFLYEVRVLVFVRHVDSYDVESVDLSCRVADCGTVGYLVERFKDLFLTVLSKI